MDTPRTNLGDATFLGRPPPDFDMTQEPSFQSPSKDNNLLQQLRAGRGPSLRTPRATSRAPLGNKQNLPLGLGGAEFTPMLKSATRNSRRGGKENSHTLATPALGRSGEDMDVTNVPIDASLYGGNRSYVERTPIPQVDEDTGASTPLVMPQRRGGDKGPLHDGNQLSLREQENVIDRIEKENFGLKLKIHFLEEALRKAGPGFSEAALKENTELKVDKVTMQRDLQKFKKQLVNAEKDLETYQQQILDVQAKAKKKYANEDQQAEIAQLQRALEDKEADIDDLRRQLERGSQDNGKLEQYQDDIADLEADLRAKDREINDREDELEDAKSKLEDAEMKWREAQRRIAELEERERQPDAGQGKIEELEERVRDLELDLREKENEANERDEELNDLERKLDDADQKYKVAEEQLAASVKNNKGDELSEAKDTIEDLEAQIRKLERENDDLQERFQEAKSDKNRAEADLEELHEEMANKSVVTKGLSRQVDEKALRLQAELTKAEERVAVLEKQLAESAAASAQLQARAERFMQQQESWEIEKRSLESAKIAAQNDLRARTDEKNLLQLRVDSLSDESASLQRDVARLQRRTEDLEDSLDQERDHAAQLDRDARSKHKAEVDRLNDDIADLKDEVQHLRTDASSDKTSSLEREVTRLQNRIKEMDATLDAERSTARTRESSANEEATSLRRELSHLQQRIADLETDLTAARASTRTSPIKSTSDSGASQREIARLQGQIRDLELTLDQERSHGRKIEQDVRAQLKSEIDRLHAEISALQVEIRTKDNEYDNAMEKWESERRSIEAQRERVEERAAGLQRTIDRLRDSEGTLSNNEMRLQGALTSEAERHQIEIDGLNRQVESLRAELEVRQSTLTSVRNELSGLRVELRKSQSTNQAQAEKVEALEDEVEVLQATLDEESEDAASRLRDADQMCSELKRQLDQLRRGQTQGATQARHLEDANSAADDLRLELAEAQEELEAAMLQIDQLRRQLERVKQAEVKQADARSTLASQESAELRKQLERANRTVEKSSKICEQLREELEQANADIEYLTPVCKELRAKLDRARHERSEYRATSEKLARDCERLKEGAKEALAWIQARNGSAEQQDQQQQTLIIEPSPAPVNGGVIKPGALAQFRYGNVVMNVVDQQDHEAVIRAADAASKKHEQEIRGVALQMQWMQARWEREVKLRNDAAFAKKYISLQLEIAQACNKADLRILTQIHKQLGIKSPEALLINRRQQEGRPSPGTSRPTTARTNLKVFATLLRAVARMRISAREWNKQEQTRLKLVGALDEHKRRKQKAAGVTATIRERERRSVSPI